MRFIFYLILLCNFSLFSQVLDFKKNSIEVQIHDTVLLLNKKYTFQKNNDSIAFSNIKFYISNPLVYKNDSLIKTPSKRYHLVDLNDPESLVLQTETQNFDKIQFNLGIDKQTNLDGVKGGDLDPLKGMYWTWNTGYINIKIEGVIYSKTDGVKFFKYHIGGFEPPMDTSQRVTLTKFNNQPIIIEMNKFLSFTDFSKDLMVLSPGATSVELSSNFKNSFR
ncbi:MAG: MbnP family protein [Flavobacteriaceae bacterium]